MLNDQLRWCGFNKIDYGYRRNIIDLTKCIRIPRLEGMDIKFVEEFIIELKKAIDLANNFKYNGYTYIID